MELEYQKAIKAILNKIETEKDEVKILNLSLALLNLANARVANKSIQ